MTVVFNTPTDLIVRSSAECAARGKTTEDCLVSADDGEAGDFPMALGLGNISYVIYALPLSRNTAVGMESGCKGESPVVALKNEAAATRNGHDGPRGECWRWGVGEFKRISSTTMNLMFMPKNS